VGSRGPRRSTRARFPTPLEVGMIEVSLTIMLRVEISH
jgi:hypothetical protein